MAWLAKLALRRIDRADRYGLVDVDGPRIVGFKERGTGGGAGLINGGIYLFSRRIIERIDAGFQSLEAQIFPQIAAEGRLFGSVYAGNFLDIGIPEALLAAQTEI